MKAVGRTAQTRQRITGFLGSSQLGEQFSKAGQPVEVLVRLDASSGTKSGYSWSTSQGPPYAVDSMTLATGSVRLAAAASRSIGCFHDHAAATAASGPRPARPGERARTATRRRSPGSAQARAGKAEDRSHPDRAPDGGPGVRRRLAGHGARATTAGMSRWRNCGSPAASRGTARGPATSSRPRAVTGCTAKGMQMEPAALAEVRAPGDPVLGVQPLRRLRRHGHAGSAAGACTSTTPTRAAASWRRRTSTPASPASS